MYLLIEVWDCEFGSMTSLPWSGRTKMLNITQVLLCKIQWSLISSLLWHHKQTMFEEEGFAFSIPNKKEEGASCFQW